MITMLRDSPHWMPHPEFLFRSVPGQGMVQKVMTSHAVAFHATRIRMTDNFCPLEQFDRVAFEPSWFLSAEPLLKFLKLYLRPWQMDEVTLSHYGVWGDGFISGANLRESAVTHAYPLREGWPAGSRRREELAANHYVLQMQGSRSIHRLWRTLRDAGLREAALWLAAAHMHGRLRRRLLYREPLTLFVPNDGVLRRIVPDEAARLLADGALALVAFLKMHVAPGSWRLAANDRLSAAAEGTIVTYGGGRYAVGGRGDVRVLQGPIRVDDIAIYVVDRPLSQLRLRPATGIVDFARAVSSVADVAYRVLRKVKRAIVPIIRRSPGLDRLASAARDIWTTRPKRSGDESRPAASFALNTQAVNCYRHALAARAVRVLQHLYRFYDARVLAGVAGPAAPALQLASIPLPSTDEVLAKLKLAVASEPTFAEAWLELGYALTEGGDDAAALAAFERAGTLTPTVPRAGGQADLRSIAALERAYLLQRQGQVERALKELDAMKVTPPFPWRLHLWRARALLDLGRTRDALSEFEQSLQWDHWEGRFDNNLPREIVELRNALDSSRRQSAASVKP
jgi:tetratricopeptide (TPR) repeat protein